MAEQIEILDHLGRKTGRSKDRAQIHMDGDWHSSSHLWLIDESNRILLQKRSPAKLLYPSRYCPAVSGHIEFGTEPVETLIKEAQEELGVVLQEADFFLKGIVMGTDDVQIAGKVLKEREFIYTYISHKPFEVDLDRRDEEVDGFVWMEFEEFEKLVQERSSELVPMFEVFALICSYVRSNSAKSTQK